MNSYDRHPELDVTAEGPVRVVTLNRPDELNACSEAMRARSSVSRCPWSPP
ncbi:MAG TPA: hypothetical protein VHC18_24640 [Amycolatopsis sp.]|nr:hypothetical protein [Amycolatopsis sp.]